MCRDLRFPINFKVDKSMSPAPKMMYVGIVFCLNTMTISLDDDRISKMRTKMDEFISSDSVTVRQVRKLVGVLVFASLVVALGRCYYQSLLRSIRGLGACPHPGRRVPLEPGMIDDVHHWQRLLSLLSSRSAVSSARRPRFPGELCTDASFTGWGFSGFGIFEFGRWPAAWKQRIGRDSELADIWICELEILALLFGLRAVLPRCRGALLRVRVDNDPVCSMVRRLSTRSPRCLQPLREIAWLLTVWDVVLDVSWISSEDNWIADYGSRAFDPNLPFSDLARAHLTARSHGASCSWLQHWPPRQPARPELVSAVPATDIDGFGGPQFDVSSEQAADIRRAWTQQ
jgi:hypothetical protein